MIESNNINGLYYKNTGLWKTKMTHFRILRNQMIHIIQFKSTFKAIHFIFLVPSMHKFHKIIKRQQSIIVRVYKSPCRLCIQEALS